MSIGGMWPLQNQPSLFYLWLTFCILNLCLMLGDLIQVLGDLNCVITNLCATAPLIMITSKMLVLKYSTMLRKLMRQVELSENEIDFKNEEERRIYMSYNSIGLKFFRIVLWISLAATSVYYIKNLKINVNNEQLAESIKILLPYRIYIFHIIQNIRNYYIFYACECPMVYIATCHGIIACFVWSLIIDVCGQLSVLSFRIRNMQSNSPVNRLESVLRDIIQRHDKLIWNSKIIDGAFNLSLLVELVACTIIMALCMYNMIVNSNFSDATEFLSFLLYILMMFVVIYGYCFAGELLAQESLNVRDSCYECDWYNMPPRCKKMLIMCMIRTRTPLQMTGGGFYIYNIESLTSVLKTAMAYGSMLRHVA
nr:olfactory receptor 63 [Gregopimpla kuwanae]